MNALYGDHAWNRGKLRKGVTDFKLSSVFFSLSMAINA